MVGRTRGIIGACVGLLPLAVVMVFPKVARTPTTYAQGMAVAMAITTIHTAETQYYSQFGQYAPSLTQLGPEGAGLIDQELASGRKSGFEFVLWRTRAGYSVSAKPVGFGSREGHTYYSDQSMCIHQQFGAQPATVNCPPLDDPVHGTPVAHDPRPHHQITAIIGW